MSIRTAILNNINLKILALVMAILLWLYVTAEQGNIEIMDVIDRPVRSESVEL